MLPALGTASNSAVKEPVWLAKPRVSHAAAGGGGGAAGVGGWVTLMAARPVSPDVVALMVAEPALMPVTSPLAETVATPLLLLDQVKVCPEMGFPLASLATAASCTVLPTFTLPVAGTTETDATVAVDGAVTVTAAVPVIPPLVAEVVAEPGATAVTSPLADTVATEVLLLLQVKLCPLRTLPLASLATAASCAVPPTVRLAVAGVTTTEATAAGGGVPPPVVRVKLHTDALPMSLYVAQSASDVAPLCSLRKA